MPGPHSNTHDLSGLWALAADLTAPACGPAIATQPQPQHLLQPLHHSLLVGQGHHQQDDEVVSPLFSSPADLTDWERVFGELTAGLNDNAPATPDSTTHALLVPSSSTSTISGGSSSSRNVTSAAAADVVTMDVDFAVGVDVGASIASSGAVARRSSHSNSSCDTNLDFATTSTDTTSGAIVGRRKRPVRSAAAAATMAARRYATEIAADLDIDMDEHSDDDDDDDDDDDRSDDADESDGSDGSDAGISSRRPTPTRTGGRPQRRRRHQQKQKQPSGSTLSRRKFPNDYWELTDEEIVAIDFKRLTVLMSDAGLSAEQVSEAKARRRRLKNRQSARVCSNKKRESYIKLTEINNTLRDRVAELEAQVSVLQRDNSALKKRSAKSGDASATLKANLQKALGLLAANGIAANF